MSSQTRAEIVHRLDQLDDRLARWMASHGVQYLRVSLGVIFLWFGALKLFPGLSPAEGLVGRTILALTFGWVGPEVSVPVLGVCESLIGLGLLTGRACRLVMLVFFIQMSGTATPLFLLPDVTFVDGPFVLTMEGQYIVKNLVLVSGAFIVWATSRGRSIRAGNRARRERLTDNSGVFEAALLTRQLEWSRRPGEARRT